MSTEVIFETNLGNITIQLHEDKVPETTKNFLDYVNSGFYDNTIFHRVIENFVVQGGGFTNDMEQKDTKEPVNNEADKGELNAKGTLSMARTSDPHSATSQFFINLNDNSFLNHSNKNIDGWGYCVFGHITDGMDVVEKIGKSETTFKNGHADVPIENITVLSAKVK